MPTTRYNAPVDRNPLGASGLTVPPIVLGTMWHRLEAAADRERVVHAAIDLGFDAIDTAPLYGFGASETELGRALAGRRQDVLLLTKVGLRWDADHGAVLFEAWIDGRLVPVRRDSRPASIRAEVEASLRRLRTDVLDGVQVHQWDDSVPAEDAMGALATLVGEGKVRAVGLCNHPPDEVARCAAALGPTPLGWTQDASSLVTRAPHAALAPVLERLDAALLAYSPLEAGLLAGSEAGGDTKRGPLFHPRNRSAISAAVADTVVPIAAAHGVDVAQVALAWVLGRAPVAAVVCGASSEAQLRGNLAAATLRLAPDERQRLDERFASLRIDRNALRSPSARARQWVRRRLAGVRRRLLR